MTTVRYIALLGVLLLALLSAISQMRTALDEIDIERFCLWTCIASVIAGMPVMMWSFP